MDRRLQRSAGTGDQVARRPLSARSADQRTGERLAPATAQGEIAVVWLLLRTLLLAPVVIAIMALVLVAVGLCAAFRPLLEQT